MIQALWKNRNVVTFHYLLSLLSALAVAIPFYRTLLLETGHTLALNSLIADFDFMIFMDALRAFSEVLRPYLLRVLLLAAIAALGTTFFSGGFTDAVLQNKFRMQRFLIQSGRYWGRMLILAIVTGLLALICTALAVFISVLAKGLTDEPDHRMALLRHVPAVLFFLLGQGFLFLVWDYARVILVGTTEKSVSGAFTGAIRTVTHSFRPALLFISLLLAVLAGLGLYLLTDKLIRSAAGVIVIVLVQQVYIYYRTFLRLLHLKLAAGQVQNLTRF
ncbi:MAG: hypothetical protein KF870_14545 [Leadbetterella sp.]|nr:hypothetical protein [Leadbetterella sp.]